MVTLYCRTDKGGLEDILSAGLETGERGLQETLHDFKAVWLQPTPPDDPTGTRPYILRIDMDCQLDDLDLYDARPGGQLRREWLVPVDLIHARGRINVSPE
ncbi:MAG TPA: hypothetical protein VGO93_23580 [Candidatus Xenobia bacterium]